MKSIRNTLSLVSLAIAMVFAATACSEDGVQDITEDTPPPTPDTVWSEGHHYRLPVVFHVLYSRDDNRQQYTDPGHLQKIIDNVNLLYKNCGTDMGLEFVMATHDPQGNPLSEPGVNRLKWSPSVMRASEFMKSSDEKNLALMWDQNRYINIVLYTFTDNNLMGYSSFPYTVVPATLEGCEQISEAILPEQLSHPQCVSINNKFIYDMRQDYTQPCTPETYIPSDIVVTMAHEIAHYLGLRHAFSEDITLPNPYNTCIDSDFCDDTPTYNKHSYDMLLKSFGTEYPQHFTTLVERVDCNTNDVYVSTNIMDYAVTYGNTFTDGQARRIRYILENGIFVPGPKRPGTATAVRGTRATHKVVLPICVME